MKNFLKITSLILVLLSLLVTVGCTGGNKTATSEDSTAPAASISDASSEPENTDVNLGKTSGNVYANESLGISMEIPEGWYSLSDEQRMEMMQAGAELLAGDDKNKQTALDLAAQKTLMLVNAFETDPLTATGPNPNIQLIAEKMTLLNSAFVKSADDYITATKAQLETFDNIEGIPVAYTFGDIQDIDINGKTFRLQPMQLEMSDGTVLFKQDYYVYFDKKYAYTGISTYMTDDQYEIGKAAFETLKIA